MLGDEVRGKMSKMYRIESTRLDEDSSTKKLLRRKIKTILFLTVDILLLVMCVLTFIFKYQDWEKCRYDFDGWIGSVVIISAISLIVDIADSIVLWKIE